jgi:hypothetical protein
VDSEWGDVLLLRAVCVRTESTTDGSSVTKVVTIAASRARLLMIAAKAGSVSDLR